MDRDELADFLRRRRDALQPADVGLNPGARRRTRGLRREEVAGLCSMSTDYYTRLEQRRGPQPSGGGAPRGPQADRPPRVLVFTATPGSEDADKLELLKVIGDQRFGMGAQASAVGS